MDLSVPLRSFFSDVESRTFLALDKVANGMTGRQVTEVIRSNSPSHVRRALKKLEGLGVVTSRQVGNAYVYETNKEHILWPIIQAINSSSEIFKQRIRDLVQTSAVPNATVWIYGSTARRTSTSKSDIDLVLIVSHEVSDDKYDELFSQLQDCGKLWTGNVTNVYSRRMSDLPFHIEIKDPLLDSWIKEAKPIIGQTPQEIFGAFNDQKQKTQ